MSLYDLHIEKCHEPSVLQIAERPLATALLPFGSVCNNHQLIAVNLFHKTRVKDPSFNICFDVHYGAPCYGPTSNSNTVASQSCNVLLT
jgi:hypothetical protein